MIKVLYEDNHLIAVLKPAGVLVQGDDSKERSLMDDVKDYLKEKYNKPGNVFLGLIHRLDRPVEGIVLFAKTSKGASRISEQFRLRSIVKIYHCVVEGKVLKDEGTISGNIEKTKDRKAIFSKDGEGKESSLSYRVLERSDNFSLLEIDLSTGRFHQIRAALASIGHPVVGDIKYGAKNSLPNQVIALASVRLDFKTATEDKPISLSIPDPEMWIKILNG